MRCGICHYKMYSGYVIYPRFKGGQVCLRCMEKTFYNDPILALEWLGGQRIVLVEETDRGREIIQVWHRDPTFNSTVPNNIQ